MNFISKNDLEKKFENKTVAVVGSGPSVLLNSPGYIDSYDIVVRVNNYNTTDHPDKTGTRTDIHYSFYGSSVGKTREELINDGVYLCMCKCPNSKPIESKWHESVGKIYGIDFRAIYRRRQDFWFCDTYVPDDSTFISYFNVLNKHIPTTGFQAILELLSLNIKSLYITGFDFFNSGIHNLNQKWKLGDPNDPIKHMPLMELDYLLKLDDPRIILDDYLKSKKGKLK